MTNYYTDSAKKSLWVLTQAQFLDYDGMPDIGETLTCFAASPDSGYHIGQQVYNPKLQNSNWKPLEGRILVEDILKDV